ncbi:nucleoside-diphosphate-sugar epimerase [Flavobacterium cutihirudinis]|uniref:Nucleoside-diphosphate-sugar epimerase n=1 Tax=Flavobacterium cutihirudinis TaxID=1265740 RepID=A0A3D9FKK5_9FLAO|nr:NAD-dependent epimerase/dehydratase family protein [Flavobacterium cutihirudinis]RED19598.1 nucleoside-diphosphate-sugar epimerase [Flavobacterium cutihirudinis]
MEIIITGGTGFVGINLFEYLKKNHLVKNLSIRYSVNQKMDLNVDAIIHLAGKAHDLKNVSRPTDYYEANFELTKQVFDSFLKSKATVFVFLSSVKAVADQVNDILTEDTVATPRTHYGISKRKAEEYLLSKQLPSNKRLYILRPCMIHGPGNKGNLNLLYNFVLKNRPWPLGAFNNRRSFLSVENLCFAINELLENEEIPTGIYHISDDKVLSTNELIQIIGMNLGKKSTILEVSPWVIKAVAKLGDYLSLPLNSERLNKLTENYEVSNLKIKKALKKDFPVSSKEGLNKTIKSFI